MQPRKILCVDDQRVIHALEESMLSELAKEGTAIVHAYDGLEALRRLTEHSDVDLILLDINMPVLNGLAFLEQKARTPFAAIPVIIITSEGADQDEVRHAISLGATRVLAKPFGFEELDAVIRDIA